MASIMKEAAKEAAKDAAEYAAAKMSYGEGAGTRRKLIESAVSYKAARIPAYGDAFSQALDSQDITKHIKSARRHRVTKDVGQAASKNIKALARGDKNGMSTPLIVGVIVLGVAHRTGYDAKIWYAGKAKVADVRAWLKAKL